MALCSLKILKGLHAQGKNLGLEHDDLSRMVSTGSLATVPEREAAELLRKLRAQENPYGKQEKKIWRLYSSSDLAREIDFYRRQIAWKTPGGFEGWLKTYHQVERLGWVDSKKKAFAIKNGLKRIYNDQKRGGRA